jgi:hypothetical protein
MERPAARRGKSGRQSTCHIDDLNGVLYEEIDVRRNRVVLDRVSVLSLAIELVTLLTFHTFFFEATAMLKSFDLDFDYNTNWLKRPDLVS